MPNSLRFDEVSFRACIRTHARSVFVGYADATLVVPEALPDGSDLELRICKIELKVVNGVPRIDFKSIRGENGQWYPVLFPKSGKSRVALTEAILQDRMVNAVVRTVLEDLENGQLSLSA
jgi:hypothetical protein